MYKSGSFLKIPNKYWEIQTEYWKDWTSYFEFHINWTRKMDHAGFRLRIELFRLYLGIDIYDNRHWNDETDDWEKYPQGV